MHAKKILASLVFILIATGLACSLSAPTPASWVGTPSAEARIKTQTAFAETQSAQQTSLPTLPPTKTATPVVNKITPTTTEVKHGPWLIYPDREGKRLFFYDVNSQSVAELNLPEITNLSDLIDGLSPDGKQLLMRAGQVEAVDELALYSITNPYEDPTKISPLLSLSIQRDVVNQTKNRSGQTCLAVKQAHGIAWTQDGSLVAFTAALDWESADIYVYDPSDNTVERMTVRYRQNLTPFWSQDMSWLIFQEAENINDKGDWEISAVSEVSMPYYNTTRFLYLPPEGSVGDVMLGWLNDNIFLSYSRHPDALRNLRQVNLAQIKETFSFTGSFNDIAFDPDSKVLALSVDASNAQSNGLTAGIYMSTTGGEPFSLRMRGEFNHLDWSKQAQKFLAADRQNVYAFNLSGDTLTLRGESRAVFSPGATWALAWSDDLTKPGLRLYTSSGLLLQTITDQSIIEVIWQPDSTSFFYVSEQGLFKVSFPLLEPEWITDNVYQAEDFHAIWLLW
jgi:hypothetical protein